MAKKTYTTHVFFVGSFVGWSHLNFHRECFSSGEITMQVNCQKVNGSYGGGHIATGRGNNSSQGESELLLLMSVHSQYNRD